MRIVGGMKCYTFEEILDEDLGPIGTPERDAFEAEVRAAVEADKQKLARQQEAANREAHRTPKPKAQRGMAAIPAELQLS